MIPADDLAAIVEADFGAVQRHRTVITATNVVFTAPDQLHRGLFSQQRKRERGLGLVVRCRRSASTKRAAGINRVDLDLLRLQSEHLADRSLDEAGSLAAIVKTHSVCGGFDDAIQRFHRRVRQKREQKLRLDRARGAVECGLYIGARDMPGIELRVIREFAMVGYYLLGAARFAP